MIHKIVSVYDVKAEFFGTPVFVKSTGEAIRSFGDAVNSKEKDNNFAKYPQDFILFEIGEFDDATGELTERPAIELVKGINIVEPSTPNTLPSPTEEAA